MNRRLSVWVGVCIVVAGPISPGYAALPPEQLEKLPKPTARQVDFANDIKPIFEARCISCHGRGKNKGSFALDSRETMLRGGDSGPAVVIGQSAESYLIELVSGLDPDNVMPQKGTKLTADEVGLLRAWIDEGAGWDASVTFARAAPINLKAPEPRLPVGPAARGLENGIDTLLKQYFHERNIEPGPKVSDRIFARRAYLDVIGLLPTPAELERFLAEDRPDKRERLVRRLLADNEAYAQHWLTFWNDLLRNDYQGTGYIDDGRKQITGWLYSALADNMPFDRFVAELVNPTPQSEGFVKGIVWRGVVNASQTPEMQAAQNISQVFMGVNLKCASCHDSFINDWTLADAYGLASVYADGELEMVHCDKPTGKTALMKFLYPELGNIDPSASKPDRLEQLAGLITQKQNGRLSRTIVNRLWARFMGRGLVEPLDDMEQPAWHPELLDWLAADLVENGYDLRKSIERILTSEAYQLASVPATEGVAKEYTFRGPLVRRISAEQFQDAISRITGVWHAVPASTQADFSAGRNHSALSEVENPARLQWIWSDAGAEERAQPGTVYFRKVLALPAKPAQASMVIACDNSFKLFVNGKEAASGRDHNKPVLVDLMPHLKQGENVFAVEAVNRPAHPDSEALDQANPAGLICYARIRGEKTDNETRAGQVWDLGSSSSWRWSTEKTEGWQTAEFVDSDWASAAELGNASVGPWNLERKLAQSLSSASLVGHVRASLVAADPLLVALGRPNREQVITSRASAATTLQALELTNGKTLADHLKRGSERLLAELHNAPNRDLIDTVFERALARPPAGDERDLAEELVGKPARQEGLEDLLWTVAMLPEFQLIY
ncbi:MAG: DUF1549 domain-containing protein [Verrucomicrobiia bacterium]